MDNLNTSFQSPSTQEPSLTPVNVRGKRKSEAANSASILNKGNNSENANLHRVEQAVIAAAGSSMAEHQAALSAGRIGTLHNHKTIEKHASALLEMLPIEILERIFMYADSISFPKASPLLGRALSQPAVLKAFTMQRFALTWDHYHGRIYTASKVLAHEELKESEDGKIQGILEAEVISQKWFKLDIFVGALELWHRSRNMTHFYTCKFSRADNFIPQHEKETADDSEDEEEEYNYSEDEGNSSYSNFRFMTECNCPKPLSVSACVDNMWRLFTGFVQRGHSHHWLSHLERDVGIDIREHDLSNIDKQADEFGEMGWATRQFLRGEREKLDKKSFSDLYARWAATQLPDEYSKYYWYPSFRCIDSFNHCVIPDHLISGPWAEQEISWAQYAHDNPATSDASVTINGKPPYVPLPAPSTNMLANPDDVARMKLIFLITHPDWVVFNEEDSWDNERRSLDNDWELQMRLFKKYMLDLATDPLSTLKMAPATCPVLPVEVQICLYSCFHVCIWPLPDFMVYTNKLDRAGKKLQKAIGSQLKNDQGSCLVAMNARYLLEGAQKMFLEGELLEIMNYSWFIEWLVPRTYESSDYDYDYDY